MSSPYLQFYNKWTALYVDGLNTRDIAKIYNVAPATVWRGVKARGKIRSQSQAKIGSNNPQWKGDKATKVAIHVWVGSRLPKPSLCLECNARPPFDLANVSPTYNADTYNHDFKNWRWLCRKCHMLSDGRLKRLRQSNAIYKSKRTHCKNGHEYTESNTRYRANGIRNCKTCNKTVENDYSLLAQ